MAGQRTINIGNQSNDGTGDSIRDAFNKVNENFSDIYNLVGAGNGFSFLNLNEAPSYLRASNSASGQVTVLGINEFGTKILNKTMVAGTGMQLVLYDDTIIINSTSSNLSSESSPVLGGNLDGRNIYNLVNMDNNAPHHDYDAVSRKWVYDNFVNRDAETVYDTGAGSSSTIFYSSSTIRQNVSLLTTATTGTHLVNKFYADTKIGLAGTSTIDTFSGLPNPALGTMTGALLLFRDPVDTDHPSQAATKNYVDNSSFVSQVNFFVSLYGNDNRIDIPAYKKGRAWAYAFKTINQACYVAEQYLNSTQVTLGPYQKTISIYNEEEFVTLANLSTPSTSVLDASQFGITLTVGVPTALGSDAFQNGSLFPGNYIVGARSGATALIERITTGTESLGSFDYFERYDVVPVDYASSFPSDLEYQSGTTATTITYRFVTPNLIKIPSFWTDYGYTFRITSGSPDYATVSQGTVVETGYYTDVTTGYVYDTVTVDFTQGTWPTNTNNIINGNWHIYSGYGGTFDLGEELIWGQYQPREQITINIESGEHEDQYPIRVPNNVSLKGDEFRRSVVKPAKLYGSQISSISDSIFANTKFYRDTQVDGIIPVQLNTSTNYAQLLTDPISNATTATYAVPSAVVNSTQTNSTVFSVYEVGTNAEVYPPASWVGQVFQGGGGQGEITSVIGNTFAVNLAQNAEYVNELTVASGTQLFANGHYGTNNWYAVYEPINYGFHYLRDSSRYLDVLTTTTNNGGFLNAAAVLAENKKFIQTEVTDWFATNFSYSTATQELCYRDAGTIVDGLVSDLTTGGWWRTVNNGDSIVNYVTSLTTACVDTIYQIGVIAQYVLQNTTSTIYNSPRDFSSSITYNEKSYQVNVSTATALAVEVGWTIIDPTIPAGFSTITAVNTFTGVLTTDVEMIITPRLTLTSTATFVAQTLDGAYTSESGSYLALADLVQACARIVANDPAFNPPLYNDQMDVFLMNDSTMIRYLSCQGHGGFMKVLDPAGQILAKSPYTQTASSFSKSYNRHVFSGGMFVDGFTGNVTATPDPSQGSYAQLDSNNLPTKIAVYGLGRPDVYNTSTYVRPQTPCFFVNNGITYDVDFISEFDPVANYGVLNLNPDAAGGVKSFTFSAGSISGFAANTTTTLTFSSPQAPGGLAAYGTVTTNGTGVVTNVTVTFPGVGYESVPTFTIGGAFLGFSYNAGTGAISGYNIILPGTGYKVGTPVNFNTPQGGTAAAATVSSVNSSGGITGLTFSTHGTLYNSSNAPATYTFGTINYNNVTILTEVGYLGTLPTEITLVTAGNRSMLANDFTQLNDLGYGIFATNGGFIENVSMFSYYCHTSYYALNGAQLRTITGSSAYGDWGLVAEGSNPQEVPISVINKNPMVVEGTIVNTGNYITLAGASTIYVNCPAGYIPQLQSYVDILQDGYVYTYTVKSATSVADGSYSNLYSLAISYGAAGTGLADVAPLDGQGVTLRIGYDQELIGLQSSVISRPSTAMIFNENPNQVYKILSYTDEGNDTVIAEGNVAYDYIVLNPYTNIAGLGQQGIGNISWADKRYVGPSNTLPVGIINSGTGYASLGTYHVTFPTPPTITAQSNGVNGTNTAPVSVINITGASGTIHPGMIFTTTSLTAVIPANTYVSWANSTGSNVTTVRLNNNVYGLANSDHIGFVGVAATGTAHVSAINTIDYIQLTNHGAGYPNNVLYQTGTIDSPGGGGTQATVIGSVQGIIGSDSIKIAPLGSLDQARITTGLSASTPYYYYFGYLGKTYRITGYTPPSITGDASFGEIQFVLDSDGVSGLQDEIILPNAVIGIGGSNAGLQAGIGAGQTGNITVKISTLRATAHDMVDVGTGGYATSKIPNDLYGPPLQGPFQSQEVNMIGKGVVYYVTTDQDGNFRVGEYFNVDQGHGTVTISAPIGLSNVDSITFKRGDTTVNRFSTDGTMAANATTKVPVEQAIVTFVNKRLGLDQTGAVYQQSLLGPGFLDRTGLLPMTGNINMNSEAIINVSLTGNTSTNVPNKGWVDEKLSLFGIWATDWDGITPRPNWGKMQGPLDLGMDPITGISTATQAASKRYVDQRAQFSRLPDVTLTNPVNQDLVMFSSTTVPYNTASQYTVWSTTTQAVNVSLSTATITNTSSANGGGSDVAFTRVNNTLTIKLVGGNGANNPITDYHVNNNAAIQQSKLAMQAANTAQVSAPRSFIQADLGLATFDPSYFMATNGWVTFDIGNNVVPNATNTYNLGSNADRWATVYGVNADFTAGTTFLSTTTVNNTLTVTLSTNATNTMTGALVVTGGVGIGRDLWIGGNLYVNGSRTIINSTAIETGDALIYLSTATSSAVGANNSGIAVGPVSTPWITFEYDGVANFVSSNGLKTSGGVDSTSITTGDLQIGGGVGIGKNTYMGGSLNVAHVTTSGYVVVTNDLTVSGNATVTNTLNVSSTFNVGNKFNVQAVTGNLTINTNKFQVDAGTGNVITAGSIGSTGSFVVGASKFTVDATSGNIVAAGTITGNLVHTLSFDGYLGSGSFNNGSSVSITTNQSATGGSSNLVSRNASGDVTIGGNLTATNIWGTLETASQPNVTTMAGLTSASALATVGTITSGVWHGSTIDNTYLTNNTISGIALGSNLDNLTAGTGITIGGSVSGTYNGGTAETIATVQDISTSASPTFNALTIGVLGSSQGIVFTNGGVLIPYTSTNVRQLTFAPESAVSNGVAGQVDFAVENLSTAANGQASVYVRADNSGAKIQLLAANSNASTPVNSMGGLYGTSPNGMFLWENSSCLMQFLASGTGAASAYNGRSPDSVAQLTINGSWDHANAYNQATVTINGGLGVSGKIYSGSDMYATIFHGTATSAYYADLAEKYLADADCAPGTVMSFGGVAEVTASVTYMDRRVAGVVSTNPAHLMNDKLEGGIAIALTGRVPCKVVGTIKKGDMLVASGIKGVATSDPDPKLGAVIGKALEDYNSQSIGVIEVVVGRL